MVAIVDLRPVTPPLDHLATMSLEEYSRVSGAKMTTIRNMARAGTLPVPCVRIGRQYRIPVRAVEAWLGLDQHDDAA